MIVKHLPEPSVTPPSGSEQSTLLELTGFQLTPGSGGDPASKEQEEHDGAVQHPTPTQSLSYPLLYTHTHLFKGGGIRNGRIKEVVRG